MGKPMRWLGSLLLTAAAATAGDAHFVGPEPCALCHKDIAAKQQRTAMATTWQGRLASWIPASFRASVTDDLPYELKRAGAALTYSVNVPGQPQMSLPVDISVGGRRHGLGFLIPVQQIDGIPLARSALIQARYAWSPEKKRLLLAPGCSAAKPQSLEAALGLVLSPTFESRCLSCHGKPNLLGSGKEGGVHCESCHGPGSEHLAAIGRGSAKQGIVNPERLSTEDSIAICARCHVGLTRFSDPSPADLLVANQVRAIKSSECFLQSPNGFSCTTCHDPHNDATDDHLAVKACVGCHAVGVKRRAAICPVSAITGCIGCHMPTVEMGPLHLVDHLIRVHPEQKIQALKHEAELKTQAQPISEYLRMIAVDSAEAGATARDRLNKGELFYKVALETSVDRSAAIGGYLGRRNLAELGDGLPGVAVRLGYGQTSSIVQSGGRWVILQRLPRDFRWEAEQLQSQAEDLATRSDARVAIGKAQEALMVYPQFLRALNFIGIAFAQNGNPTKAASVLTTTASLYPGDAATQFALASTLEILNDKAKANEGYKRAIALEGDFTAAYAKLGMLSYSSGDWRNAIATFRQGLQIDPMSANLYYDLGLALMRSGDTPGANRAMALAHRLNPSLVE
jgi:tetratricopeptide (TPR) repeat protein